MAMKQRKLILSSFNCPVYHLGVHIQKSPIQNSSIQNIPKNHVTKKKQSDTKQSDLGPPI